MRYTSSEHTEARAAARASVKPAVRPWAGTPSCSEWERSSGRCYNSSPPGSSCCRRLRGGVSHSSQQERLIKAPSCRSKDLAPKNTQSGSAGVPVRLITPGVTLHHLSRDAPACTRRYRSDTRSRDGEAPRRRGSHANGSYRSFVGQRACLRLQSDAVTYRVTPAEGPDI
ncbi:hypothetical protein EYF80_033959 [Liparis tanakae]|uniref:Uncharacterized protein n=1 Tax=Liparis tanakae TaxID=230148 RepID=A0A4Z2GQD7_9TELE|nr:hypothetical protein EYF80_033959 [Liparis tanakae]